MQKGAAMERLTSNKETKDMTMIELVYNSCYADSQHNARYRDFETDIDARELTRQLLKDYADGDDAFVDEDDFDEEMLELLMYGTSTTEGLIALFYRNMWAMADLREILKEYEDAEEHGLLLRLPCKVGTKVYAINRIVDYGEVGDEATYSYSIIEMEFQIYMMMDYGKLVFGKTVFLTKSEAEAEVKENGE